jgi:hypothetical protein
MLDILKIYRKMLVGLKIRRAMLDILKI